MTPATVKREEHGFIQGEVVAISELPATKLAIEAALQHSELADLFLKRYSARGPAPPSCQARGKRHHPFNACESAAHADRKPVPMVVSLRIGATPQNRDNVSGRDRCRQTKVDQSDPSLDQEAPGSRLAGRDSRIFSMPTAQVTREQGACQEPRVPDSDLTRSRFPRGLRRRSAPGTYREVSDDKIRLFLYILLYDT